jgi:TP901 family phage tail tape measure protein
MARYGESAEDFNAESKALEQAMQARKRVAAAEGEMTAGLNRSSSALDRATAKTRAYTQAQREAQEFDKRNEATSRSKASARDVDTAAVERNTAAQRANAAAAERAAKTPPPGGGGPGTGLIRHPELYGRQAYAPISQPRQYGAVGELPFRYGGGNARYDQQFDTATATRVQRESELNRAMQARNRISQAVAQNEAHLNELYAVGATRQASLAEATRRTGAEWGSASQQMTRHGALSSEFIQAAVRGQTSIKDIGNQALVTAGKFGAWTLAATAVYGVVRAIGTLGQGAIAGQSGAQQLRRVINNVDNRQAGADFNALSGQFNVPIEQSADAVYRMGQVFHDQADAVHAAKAALYSYQTGEVDVATSTKNLIAIQRGFGFSSNDLLKIYDQINQAQNTFGISIGDTEAGLAKAGGTFRNAGGDLDYLLGLFVAISKATGRSGTEIGTGIARAANQIRKPASQAALRGLGVDVDPNNLQLTIQRGIARARQPGADYNAIASGLFGNQYARLIAPVLRDPSGLNAALKGTSPEASKDSAAKELEKRRQQIDYQLKEIGVNMQRIGEALGRSGAFDAIGGLVKGLNGVLKLTLDLVNAFDKLPAPLRTAAVVLGELYITMRALRRFGVTDRIGAGLGFEGAQNRQVARGVGMGLESGHQAARNEYERLSRQSVVAQTTANIRQDAFTQTKRDYEKALNTGAIQRNTEAQLVAQQEVIKAENAAAAAANRAAEVELEVVTAREQVLLYERDIANIKKVEAEAGARGVAAYAEQNALYMRDAKGNVGRVGAGVAGVGSSEAARIAEQDAARQAAAVEAAGARTLGPLEQRVAPLSGALRNVGSTGNTVLGRLNPLAGAARVSAGALESGASGLQKLGGSLKGLGTSLAAFGAALGPLDIALVGFIIYESIKAKADEANKKLDETEKQIDSVPRSAAAQRRD